MPRFRPGKHPKGKAARRVVLRTPKAESAPTPEIEETQAPQSETHAQEHDGLGRLRGIIFGSLQHDQEQLHTRLENRIAAQAANTRRELKALVARLESRIAEVDSRSIRDQADLREQMQSQRISLSDAIEERGTQVTQLVTKDLPDQQSDHKN